MSYTHRDDRSQQDARRRAVPDEGHPEHVDVEPLYRLLGVLFLEPPTDDIVDDVKTWLQEWSTRDVDAPPEIADAVDLMMAGVNDETLGQQFTKLFLGIHDNVSPQPPYESLHRDGIVFGPTADSVSKWYRSVGLEVDEAKSGHPPDHVGLELHYLAELCARERDAIRAGDNEEVSNVRRKQFEFLEDHLLEWFPRFRTECLEYDPDEFYCGVLDLTDATLKAHHEELARTR